MIEPDFLIINKEYEELKVSCLRTLYREDML